MNKLLKFFIALTLTALVFAPTSASAEKLTRHTDSEGWEEWYWTKAVTCTRGEAHTFWIKGLTENTAITDLEVYYTYKYKEDGETYEDQYCASESCEVENSSGGFDKYVLLTAEDWEYIPGSGNVSFTVYVAGWEPETSADATFTFGHSAGDGDYARDDEYIDYYLSNPPFDDPDIHVSEQKNALLGYTVTNETAVVRGVVSYNFKTRKVLTSCSIPSQVDGYPIVELAPGAFLGRDDLLSVYIPASVTKLDGALDGCVQLKSITVADGNANFRGKESCLLAKDGKTLIAAPSARAAFVVPDTVETIASRAFAGSPVQEIVVPESVTRLEAEAFAGCPSLTRVIFCGDVPETDGAAFSNCTATAYYHYDFADYWEDDEIWSEDVVSKEYGAESFDGIIWKFYLDGASAVLGTWEGGRTVSTSKLTGARTLPTTLFGFPVNSIGDGAFDKCAKLTELTVPASILGICDEAFSACSALTNVVFDGDEPVTGADLFLDCSDQLTVRVPLEGVDWSVEIPGTWQDVRIAYRPSHDSTLAATSDVPSGKLFTDRQTVTLSAAEGMEIYYTFDGTSYDPDALDYTPTGSPIRYTGPFEVTEDAHILFWAFDPATGNWGRLQHLQVYLAEEDREYEMEDGNLRYTYAATADGIELRGVDLTDAYWATDPVDPLYVSLPSTIGGLSVRWITCLGGLSDELVSIVIPEGVARLEDGVFSGFGKLSEVVLPPTLTFIGDSAFADTPLLQTLDIPASVTAISPMAFSCSYLKTVRFHGDAPVVGAYDPESGEFIEDVDSAFDGGYNGLTVYRHPFMNWSRPSVFWSGATFESFSCHSATGTVAGVDWVYGYCSASGPIGLGTLTGAPAIPTNVAGVVTIPSSIDGKTVTAILPDAFRGCDGITAFVASGLSNYVTVAGAIYTGASADEANELLYWPNAAETAVVKEGVSVVSDGAFAGCRHLRELTLPASVVTISEAAIAECHELTNIVLEAGGPYFKRGDAVCKRTDYWCDRAESEAVRVLLWPRGLRDVTVPSTVVDLGDAFVGWMQLRSLTAETVDVECFRALNGAVLRGCSGIEVLSVPILPDCYDQGQVGYPQQRLANFFMSPSEFDEIECGYWESEIEKAALIGDFIPESLREVRAVAPEGETCICDWSFACARGLGTVTLGSDAGGISISDNAFAGCAALREVNVRSGEISTGSCAFDGCTNVVLRPQLDDWWIENNGCVVNVNLGGPGVSELVIADNLETLNFYFWGCDDFKRLVFLNDYPFEENCSIDTDDDWYNPFSSRRVCLNPFFRRDAGSWWCGLPVENNAVETGTVEAEGVTWSYSSSCGYVGIGTFDGAAAIPPDTEGTVTIPTLIDGTSVSKILPGAFSGCPNVTAFALSGASESLSVANGLLLSSDGSELLRVPEGATDICLPRTVRSIAEDAFDGCDRLVSIAVEPGCRYTSANGALLIADDENPEGGLTLVQWPHGVSDVVLPASVTKLGSSLTGWTGMRSLTMDTRDTSASDEFVGVLRGCTGLESLSVPVFPELNGYRCLGNLFVDPDQVYLSYRRRTESGYLSSDGTWTANLRKKGLGIPVTYGKPFVFWITSSSTNAAAYSVSIDGWAKKTQEFSISPSESCRTHSGNGRWTGSYFMVTGEDWTNSNASAGTCYLTVTVSGEYDNTSYANNALTFGYSLSEVDYPGEDGVQPPDPSEDVLREYAQSLAAEVPESLQWVEVTVGDGSGAVSEWVFAACSNLTAVALAGDGAPISLNEHAFEGCASLRELTLFSGDISACETTFDGCTNIVLYPMLDLACVNNYGWSMNISLPNVNGVKSIVTDQDFDGFNLDASGCAILGEIVFGGLLPDEDWGMSGVTADIPDGFDRPTIVVSANGERLRQSGRIVPTTWCGLTVREMEVSERTATVNGVDWTYTVVGDTVTLGSRTNLAAVASDTVGELEIPAELDGLPVVDVYRPAFANCAGITAFVVSEANPYLASRNGLLLSGGGRELIAVPRGATSAVIPSTVENLGSGCFAGCNRLESVTAESGGSYTSQDGILLSADGTTLVLWPRGRGGDVVLPESVTRLGSSLMGWDGLRKLTMLTGNGADFAGGENERALCLCTNLVSLTIPALPDSYGCGASLASLFDRNCELVNWGGLDEDIALRISRQVPASLKSVTLDRADGNSIDIGCWSMAFCTGIVSFVATNESSDVCIQPNAFAGCVVLSCVELGAADGFGVSIQGSAFSVISDEIVFDETLQMDVNVPRNSCRALASVSLRAPNGSVNVDDSAFAGCGALSHLAVACPDGGFWVNGDGVFYGCPAIDLTLSQLGSLDGYGQETEAFFSGVSGSRNWYATLRLPANVTDIDCSSLSGSRILESVFFDGNAPMVNGEPSRWASDVLDLADMPSDATVYVKPLTTGWGTVPGLFCGQMPMLYDCETVEVGGQTLSYIRGDDGIWIVKGNHSCEFSGDLEIPATIDGLPVTRITDQAFAGSSYLGRVTIPASVREVATSAFSDCPSLAALVFEGDAPSFDTTELPCPVLVHRGSSGWQVSIPGRYLGADISYIEDGLGNGTGTDADGWAWEYEELLSGGVEILGTPSNLCGHVSVPASIGEQDVRAISADLFGGNSRVTEVMLPATLAEVPESAFERCTRLKTVTLADGVCAIGDSAFRECVSLTNIVIPASVTNIGYFAFRDCLRLERVTLLGNAPHRDLGAFMGVPAFTTVSGRLGAATAIVYAEVTNKTDEITVPEAWLEELAVAHETPAGSATYEEAFEKKFGSDLKAALLKETGKHDLHGNPLHVWEDYVAGTDPLDEEDVFTATVTMENGVPKISWNPQLTPEQAARRRYVTYGATALGGGWTDVSGLTDAQRQEQGYQFFRVTVEMK